MSDPRVATRKGWFRIVNTLWEAISTARFSPTEMAVLGMLIRSTYGVKGQDRCPWSVRIAMEKTGLSRGAAERAWARLVEKNVVICHQEAKGRHPGYWGPNEEFWTWKEMPEGFMSTAFVSHHERDAKQASCVPHAGTQESEVFVPHAGTQDEVLCPTAWDANFSEVGHNIAKSGTQSRKKWDTTYPEDPFVEGVSEGPKYKKDMINTCTPLHVPNEDEEEKTDERSVQISQAQVKFVLRAKKVVETRLAIGGMSPVHVKRLAEFVRQPIPEGINFRAWFDRLWCAFNAAVEQVFLAWSATGAGPGRIRNPVSVLFSAWSTTLTLQINSLRDPPEAQMPVLPYDPNFVWER